MKKARVKILDDKDWHLWSKVTQSISPLKKSSFDSARKSALSEPENIKVKKQIEASPRYKGWVPSYSPIYSVPKQKTENIEPQMRRRLARGKLAIDATIDLHDLRQDEAHAALVRFLSVAYARQNRTVLVITGKGKKSANSYSYGTNSQGGVLRTMLPIWLSQPNLSKIISGHESAANAHGGSGAFYVRLKRSKQ